MATANWEEKGWDLINDDGFIYMRKKRPRVDPTASTSALPTPDPAAEEKIRRLRKKRALTKLKENYQKEIDQWEHLSNVLKSFQEKAQNQPKPPQLNEQTTASSSSSDLAVSSPHPSEKSESSARRLLDDQILRAEAGEAILQNASRACDMAEAICNLQEERMKQALFDLPVWGSSPRELMACLCNE